MFAIGMVNMIWKIKNEKKCTGWAIVTTMEREDGTWYTETITDIDDDTASSVDNFLTEYCENEERKTMSTDYIINNQERNRRV